MSHTFPAVAELRELLAGPGGRIRVVTGEPGRPDEQPQFPAGWGRAPAATLLESGSRLPVTRGA